MRPHVSTLRHSAVREREAIEPLCRGELDYIAGGLERRFNHVRDHLSRVIAQADTSRDRLAAARENLRAAQADQLNSIMKTLTVFATILLPLSVITGIYGMNVPLWPNPEHPATFWGILATMICLVFGLLAYFRRRNWI
ncbi:MAG: hypothetical protein D6744_10260 [Planctomycetota bacterium]|nr:MAG: hypothetical protein D6744_10260 [Planctomycetota bacterium]